MIFHEECHQWHTLRAGVHNDFWCELEKNELEQAEGEPEACPIMSVLHHLQHVAIELDVAIKVHVVEGLHGDLGISAVSRPVELILERKIVLNGATWNSGLLGLAGTEG